MICFPNAKINLGLNIVSKREDAYHNIETVFYPIPLCDVLEIVPSPDGQTKFISTGIPVDGEPESNLVMKAYRLFTSSLSPEEQKTKNEIDIFLRKNIPFGAGLGGGSADAAYMLKLANEYFETKLPNEELEKLASQIGADCPFFIRNKPVFAEGIGNIFTPVDLSLRDYSLVLVKPDIHVSTKEAYSMVKPKPAKQSVRDIVRLPVGQWQNLLVNDFEESVFSLYPAIREIKEELYRQGALYASMSGSGSSVFGIFDKQLDVKQLNISSEGDIRHLLLS